MRNLTHAEVIEVSGGNQGASIYTPESHQQFRDMAVGAAAGGLTGGPIGFAVGLVAGAITGYRKPVPVTKRER
ncbi:hypothetical protein H3005_05010 [Stenotrophomonas sp. Br8]|uniref:hypothetical protein n=1 Tax=Stenotrophomonas sp. Br8 TaxID=2759658 RepID=UPI00168B7CC4|nr:hypothetical protein [Stenotrophomonas sp. Br8]MBD3681222.1 hypothetical protein [Stenotrophomonas sp. Br8]